MGIKEKLFDHPEAFFSGCFVWVFLAIWIYALVMWMVQGDVDFIVGFIGCVVAIVLGYLAMNPPRQEMAFWIAVGTGSTVVAFPFVSNALRRRALVQIDIEDVERAYETLGQRPEDPALRFRLAKALYNRGMIHAALAVGEPALKELPRRYYADEFRMVSGWKMHATGKPPTTYGCMNCGCHNRPGIAFCQGCGGRLFLGHAKGAFVSKAMAQKFMVVWFALLLLATGIPAALLTLQVPVALGVIALMICLAVFGGISVFRQAEPRV